MNFKKFLFGALSALALTACSNEDAPAAPDAGKEGDLYARIKIQLPTASRSQTTVKPGENTNSTSGFEYGQDDENTIKSLNVVLAVKEADGSYSKGAVSVQDKEFSGSNNNVFTILFDNQEILKLADKDVYIFVFCNDAENNYFDKDKNLSELYGTITDAGAGKGIWTPDKFFMTNAPNRTIPTKKIPTKTELLTKFNTPEKAFDLGQVDVARTAARFDFKKTNNNIYSVYDVNAETKDEASRIADIKLVAMAPVNVAKEFYCLPRVSDDGTNKAWTICGEEVFNNWVVSPNFNEKNAAVSAAPSAELMAKYFYSTESSKKPGNFWNGSNFEYTILDEFNGKDDYDDNWTAGEGVDKTGYKIWRYVTENTIPATAAQKTGISTGIVFKAEITNPTSEILKSGMEAGKAIYGFNGIYYGDVEALRETVSNEVATTLLRKSFEKVFGTECLEKNDEGKFVNTITDCTAVANNNTFKILRPDTDGKYYTYYVYRNRHNDNNDLTQMGAMEFGAVRNNIYKLSVTTISGFGHTANPGDDDDPEDPNDPDEDPKTYFRVTCHVLPWMVRVNSIEF